MYTSCPRLCFLSDPELPINLPVLKREQAINVLLITQQPSQQDHLKKSCSLSKLTKISMEMEKKEKESSSNTDEPKKRDRTSPSSSEGIQQEDVTTGGTSTTGQAIGAALSINVPTVPIGNGGHSRKSSSNGSEPSRRMSRRKRPRVSNIFDKSHKSMCNRVPVVSYSFRYQQNTSVRLSSLVHSFIVR